MSVDELAGTQDFNAGMAECRPQGLVPAGDDLCAAGQCTGQKLVVVRIAADLSRQGWRINDMPPEHEKFQEWRQVDGREVGGELLECIGVTFGF